MPAPKFYSACFYSTNNGATVGRRVSADDEKTAGLPSGITNILRLDETQPNNAALLAAWAANSSTFTMSGNTVLVSSQPAGIDPPSLLFSALQGLADQVTKANSTEDAWTREEVAQLKVLVAFLLQRGGYA